MSYLPPFIPPPSPPDEEKKQFVLGSVNGEISAFVDEDTFSKNNKPIMFGPAPPGMLSYIEAAILLSFFKKLSESEKGLTMLKEIIIKYLDTTGDVLVGLYKSSATHPITAIINKYTTMSIYKRLGLMTAEDAIRNQAWVDHVLGEFLVNTRLDMAGNVLQGVSSLVESTAKVAKTVK